MTSAVDEIIHHGRLLWVFFEVSLFNEVEDVVEGNSDLLLCLGEGKGVFPFLDTGFFPQLV